MNTNRSLLTVFSIVTGLALMLSSSHAVANQLPCSPDGVSLDNVTLAIHCSNDGKWYFSASSATSDAKKGWLSMAESAILANKTLTINNEDGDGTGIVWLQLNK